MSFTQEQLIEAIEAAFAKLQPMFLQAITEELAKLQTPPHDDESTTITTITTNGDVESDGEKASSSQEGEEAPKGCPIKVKADATKKMAEIKNAAKKKASPGKSEMVAKIIKSLSTATAQKMDKAYYNIDTKRAVGKSKTNIGKYTYYSAEKAISELEEGDYIE